MTTSALADRVIEQRKQRVAELDAELKKRGAKSVKVGRRGGRIRAFATTANGTRVAGGESLVEALEALLVEIGERNEV